MKRTPTRRRATRHDGLLMLAGLLAMPVLLVAGCTSGGPGDGGSGNGGAGDNGPAAVRGTTTASGGPAAGGELVLPIDAYGFTFPQSAQLDRARQLLVRDCMRQFGFPYSYDAAQAQQRTQNLVKDFGTYGNKRRYGPTDAAAAARYGYHSPSTVEGTRPKIDVAKEKEDGSATRQLVLTGKVPQGQPAPAEVGGKPLPKGGCVGAADNRLSPGAALGEADLISGIARDSFARSLTDPTMVAAFGRWSACMKAKGYNYPTPREAGGEFDTDGKVVSPKEITAAKADVACKKQTKLVDAWRDYEVAFQQAQIEQHVPALQALKADQDAQLRRAAEITAKGS